MFSTILVVGRTLWSGTTIQFMEKPNILPLTITQNELLTEACTQLHLQALSKAISLGPQIMH